MKAIFSVLDTVWRDYLEACGSMRVKTPSLARLAQRVVVTAIVLASLLAITIWSGLPKAEVLPSFAIGIASLIACLLAFGFAFWYLFVKPTSASPHVEPIPLAASQRRWFAVLLGMSGICVGVGGFWDELWHRTYGVPFGEDFFWRPHILIYIGFFWMIALAASAAFRLLRASGSLSQRFRTNSALGLLALMGAFLFYAVPLDPVWHAIYGKDLGAWSVPHLVLTIGFCSPLLAACAILLSAVKRERWSSITTLTADDSVAILILAFVLLISLQFLTTEWDAIQNTPSHVPIWGRPQWLLQALIVGAAVFVGTLANHALRKVGAATAIGVMAFVIRWALLGLFQTRTLSASAWLCAIPPLGFLDFWYAVQTHHQRQRTNIAMNGLVLMAGMALFSYPLINQLFVYPKIDTGNLISMLASGFLVACGASWAGRAVGGYFAGDYFATATTAVESEKAKGHAMAVARRLLPVAAVTGLLIFVAFFIITATPPI